jgi:hypothetical protein
MFSVFHFYNFFLCFGFVVFAPSEPGHADRFPFLPETLRPIAKKVTDLALPPGIVEAPRPFSVGSGPDHYSMITCNLSWALEPQESSGNAGRCEEGPIANGGEAPPA